MAENRPIKAIHEFDFESILQRLGRLEAYKEGKLSCTNCGRKILKVDELSVLKREGQKIKFYCDSIACQYASTRQDE